MTEEKQNYPTLLKVLQGKTPTMEQRVVEQVIYDAPFLSKLPVRVIKGTSYRYMVRNSLPLIKSTPYNMGVGLASVDYETRSAECYPYQGRVAIDKKLVNGEPELAKRYTADLMAAHIRGALASLEIGLFYGKGRDDKGTPGLNDTIGDYMTYSATGDQESRVYGGATVWGVCLKEDMLHVVYGNNRTIAFGQRKEQDVPARTAEGEPGFMPAYVWDFDFHAGFSQMDAFSTGRIVNEGDANPLSDKMLSELVHAFPTGHTPDILVMSRASRKRLQQQRSAALTYVKKTSGGTAHADLPTDFDGIPIIVTDALLENETPEAIAQLRMLKELKPQFNTSLLQK